MTTDDEALRDQLTVLHDRGAWAICRSWDEFDRWHTPEEQDAAWSQIAAEARSRSDGVAITQGVIATLEVPKRPERIWTPPKRMDGRRDLDAIPTTEYVYTLTGADVEHGRRCDCPLPDHDDHSRDFALVRGSATNWCCYGCNRGGTIFQFAAYLWGYGVPLRGDAFREVRDRLNEIF